MDRAKLLYIEFMNTKPTTALQDANSAYISSIPLEAEERVVPDYPYGGVWHADYFIGTERVGCRTLFEHGERNEFAFKDGEKHGWQYHWYGNGALESAEPYENGVPHGTALQFDREGHPNGTYTLDHGTGIDLWRQPWPDGRVELSEVHYMKDGQPHGFEWWLSNDAVWQERYWHEGLLHGVERCWLRERRLSRGYPRFWIENEQVKKAKYIRVAKKDGTLPPFRIEENSPERELPPEIRKLIAKDQA